MKKNFPVDQSLREAMPDYRGSGALHRCLQSSTACGTLALAAAAVV
jgi:hypothetical protein